MNFSFLVKMFACALDQFLYNENTAKFVVIKQQQS